MADTLSTVYGTVVAHDSGDSLAEVTVSLAAGPRSTEGIGTRVTDSHGAFLFRSVPSGTYTLVMERVGYVSRRETLRVDPGRDVRVAAELAVSPVPLAPIHVEVRRPAVDPMEGFRRRRMTTGGSFITREQIEAIRPTNLSDVLRRVPGVHVISEASGDRVRLRGGCAPDLWVDGTPTTTAVSLDVLVLPTNVEGIEIYRGAEVPVQFGHSPCGVIVVWTRRPKRPTNGGSIRRPLLIVMGVLLVSFLLH